MVEINARGVANSGEIEILEVINLHTGKCVKKHLVPSSLDYISEIGLTELDFHSFTDKIIKGP